MTVINKKAKVIQERARILPIMDSKFVFTERLSSSTKLFRLPQVCLHECE